MQRTRNCELWKGAKPVWPRCRDEPTLHAWGKVVSVEKNSRNAEKTLFVPLLNR